MPRRQTSKSASLVATDSSLQRMTRSTSGACTASSAHQPELNRVDSDASTAQSRISDSDPVYAPVASSNARSGKAKAKGKLTQVAEATGQTEPVAAPEPDVPATDTSGASSSQHQTAVASSKVVKPYISSVEQLAKHKPVLETVPMQHRIAWTRACAAAFSAYVQAADKTEAQLIALTNLLAMPSVCLTRASGGRGKSAHQPAYRNSTAQRLNAAELAIRGETSSLLFHMQQLSEASVVPHTRVAAPLSGGTNDHVNESAASSLITDARIVSKIRRSTQKIRSGYSRCAARMLVQSQSVISPCTEEQIALVQALHPPCTTQLPSMPAASNEYVSAIDISIVRHVLPRLCNGSSAGLSGWTADHLIVLVNNEMCMSGLAKLVSDILNDKLSDEARRYIVACHLVCLPKDEDENNLRPIAIGEMFYRLAASVAYHTRDSAIMELLNQEHKETHIKHGTQYGLTVIGCQRVHASVTAMLHNRAVPKAALLIDFANAFNTIDRAAVMSAVYDNDALKPLHKTIQFAYGQSSPLYARNKATGEYSVVAQSSNGVRQGDPLASPLFALTVQKVYDAVRETIKQLYPGAPYSQHSDSVKAIHDDLTVMVDMRVDHIDAVLSTIKTAAASIGLTVRNSKCKLVWLHGSSYVGAADLDAVKVYCTDQQLLFTDHCMLLGAAIGPSDAVVSEMTLQQAKEKHLPFMQIMQHDALPVQHCMTIMRQAAAPRMDYTMQCLAPELSRPACKWFDHLVLTIAQRKLKLPSSANMTQKQLAQLYQQVMLPVRLGGLGLRSCATNASIAYIASTAKAHRLDSAFWQYINANVSDDVREHEQWHALQPSVTHLIDAFSCLKTIFTNHTSRYDALPLPCGMKNDDNSRWQKWCIKMTDDDIKSLRRKLQEAVDKTCVDFLDSLYENDDSLSEVQKQHARARHLCIRASHASDWVMQEATTDSTLISCNAWRYCARLRLGVETADAVRSDVDRSVNVARYCICGVDRNKDSYHFLSCHHSLKRMTHRHDEVQRAIQSVCNIGLMSCAVRPTFPADPSASTIAHSSRDESADSSKGSLKPDLLISLTCERSVLADVVVSHPLRLGFVRRAAAITLSSCTVAERQKYNKYKALAQRMEYELVGFACETTGGLSEGAQQLLNDIVTHAQEHNALRTQGQLRQELYGSVAAAIANGNWAVHKHMKHLTITQATNGRPAVHRAPVVRAKMRRADKRATEIAAAAASAAVSVAATQAVAPEASPATAARIRAIVIRQSPCQHHSHVTSSVPLLTLSPTQHSDSALNIAASACAALPPRKFNVVKAHAAIELNTIQEEPTQSQSSSSNNCSAPVIDLSMSEVNSPTHDDNEEDDDIHVNESHIYNIDSDTDEETTIRRERHRKPVFAFTHEVEDSISQREREQQDESDNNQGNEAVSGLQVESPLSCSKSS